MTWLTIPKPGTTIIYTSGCPKNQRRCWYNTGSPPPEASKKVVPKFRSVSSMVIAPANTGKDSKIKKAVIRIDHGNRGTFIIDIPGALIFKKVVIILIALKIEEAPDKWMAKIAKSIDIPASEVESGAYSTHPTPEPSCPFPPGAKSDATAKDAPATKSH